MQAFLRHHILTHSLTSITQDDLRVTWEKWVEDNYDAYETNKILGQIQWD